MRVFIILGLLLLTIFYLLSSLLSTPTNTHLLKKQKQKKASVSLYEKNQYQELLAKDNTLKTLDSISTEIQPGYDDPTLEYVDYYIDEILFDNKPNKKKHTKKKRKEDIELYVDKYKVITSGDKSVLMLDYTIENNTALTVGMTVYLKCELKNKNKTYYTSSLIDFQVNSADSRVFKNKVVGIVRDKNENPVKITKIENIECHLEEN